MKLNKKSIIYILLMVVFIVGSYLTYQKLNHKCSEGPMFCPDGDSKCMSLNKPVIYLYPEQTTDIHVQLDYQGKFAITYPDYDYSIKGRNVIANPDGTLINKADNKKYSYLFWEGKSSQRPKDNISQGFVIKGTSTKEFLQSKLAEIGMTPKEYNEFIVYWLPLMQDNPYNLIYFAGKDYTDIAPLNITPKPDSILRVMMVWKKLDKPIDIQPQTIKPFQRKGFTVVERGGAEIK